MAFFTYAGSKYAEKPVLASIIIDASETISQYAWCNALATTGGAEAAAATELLIGVVHEITTKDGIPLGAHISSDIDGTWTPQSGATAASYAAASDNMTDKQVKVLVNIDPSALYYNTPDAAVGTTAGSAEIGYHTDLISSVQVDESDAVTTTAQLSIWGINPGNSAQGIYQKYESQI